MGAVAAVVVLAAGVGALGAQSPSSALDEARMALVRHDVRGAIAAYTRATGDPSRFVQSAAYRELATIEWRMRGRDASAGVYFARALEVGADSGRTLLDRSRFAGARGQHAAAIGDASRALHHLQADDEWASRAAQAVVQRESDRWLSAAADGSPIAAPSAELEGARVVLASRVTRFPGRARDALALLDAALMLGNGTSAIEGWNSYCMLEGPCHRRAAAELAAVLPGWSSLDQRSNARVARALVEARLASSSALVIAHPRAAPSMRRDPMYREVLAYVDFTRKLAADVQRYYVRAAAGSVDRGDLRRIITSHTRSLWPRLDWPNGRAPAYYPASAISELGARFGAVIRMGTSGAIPDLLYAHALASSRVIVRLGPQEVRAQHVVLDAVVENGFQSWAWGGSGERYGVASGDSILQLRPTFTELPFLLWLTESDSVRRRDEATRIAKDSVADHRLAAGDSVRFLPGVAARLVRDARAAIVDSLRQLPGTLRQEDFVRTVVLAMRESGIMAHEARHVADLRHSYTLADAELRAKLSEIARASVPHLALGAVMQANVGDRTPHGMANAALLGRLAVWMRAHAAEIARYDASIPALLQLPLLTPSQLRAASRAIDAGLP